MQAKIISAAARIFRFYHDGFRNMQEWGYRVWAIIIIKLFVIFIILRIFFFSDFLKTKFDNDKKRSDYVLEQLTKSAKNQ
ncbi:MAG: DUF4492 domain-containing protein [Bacteroidales bacterium]|jgi:uncharacterized membrane protein